MLMFDSGCNAKNCDKHHYAKGYCLVHYWRNKKHGDTDRRLRIYKKTPVLDRLESKIERIPIAGCWMWTGAGDKKGYGRINIDGKIRLTHRVYYEIMVGKVPDGLELDHLCRNPSCCNPSHLEPVTRKVNTDRGLCAEAHRKRKSLIRFCKNGHDYTEENTYVDKRGRRSCKECMKLARIRASKRESNGK